MKPNATIVLVLLCAFVLGTFARDLVPAARADAPPAFDRATADRIVRAQEAQAKASEELVRAVRECQRK